MRVEPVDERDSSWEDPAPRFRVYLFGGAGEPNPPWTTATYDVVDADVLEVVDWAAARAGAERLYAVALVRECQDRAPASGRGLVWLLGVDANVVEPDEHERRQLAAMHARRAAYRVDGRP